MPGTKNYADLIVWKKGIALAKDVYLASEKFPPKEQFGLSSQIRRASISVPSNIAEGQARYSPNEFVHYLRIALGSLAELDTQAILANELGYMSADDCKRIHSQVVEIRKMIFSLVSGLKSKDQ